jgi:DeoR family fructose operon transcriptional repressor
MYMTANERLQAICGILKEKNIIRVSEIVHTFNVSIETARRDLISLQDSGLATRINGGAVMVHKSSPKRDLTQTTSFAEKNAIAKAAADMVHNGETVFLDGGITLQLMARNLKEHRFLIVITHSLMVLEELRDTDNEVIVLGGKLHDEEQILLSTDTEAMLDRYFVDKAFFSCMGITFQDGLTDLPEIINRSFLANHTEQMILLADSTKWGYRSRVKSGSLDMVDIFVVDDHIPKEMLSKLQTMGKNVVVAPTKDGNDNEKKEIVS